MKKLILATLLAATALNAANATDAYLTEISANESVIELYSDAVNITQRPTNLTGVKVSIMCAGGELSVSYDAPGGVNGFDRMTSELMVSPDMGDTHRMLVGEVEPEDGGVFVITEGQREEVEAIIKGDGYSYVGLGENGRTFLVRYDDIDAEIKEGLRKLLGQCGFKQDVAPKTVEQTVAPKKPEVSPVMLGICGAYYKVAIGLYRKNGVDTTHAKKQYKRLLDLGAEPHMDHYISPTMRMFSASFSILEAKKHVLEQGSDCGEFLEDIYGD